MPPSEAAVGLDLGVLHFATLSTGEAIENPRHYRKGLEAHQGALPVEGPTQEGFPSSQESGYRPGKSPSQGTQPTANFHHQLSRHLVNEYGLIVMEDLSILNMTATPEPKPDPDNEGQYLPNGAAAKAGLNQSILDAGWGQFQHLCTVKAERAGRRVVLVDPKYTSQLCSGCGQIVKKELSERWHSCECGTELDRDHNAALNILFRARKWPTGYGAVEASCFRQRYFTNWPCSKTRPRWRARSFVPMLCLASSCK